MTDHIRDHVLKPSMAPFQPQRSLEEFFNAFEISRLKDKSDDAGRAKLINLCQDLINEESYEADDELWHLAKFGDSEPEHLRHLAKELADLVYVAFYAAEALGIPLEKVFREVHGSNMSKLGQDGKPVRREDGKILKGPNYREPDLAKLVA